MLSTLTGDKIEYMLKGINFKTTGLVVLLLVM